MDSQELNRLLTDRLTDVCTHLFPNGKVKGNEFFVGGIDGSAGESMQITLTGSRAGRYVDFANKDDKGGTPLSLWKQARGISFVEAVKEAKEWVGIKDEDFGIKRHKDREFSRPPREDGRLSESNTTSMDYLTIERKIDPGVICRARIAETEDGSEIVFPFIEFDLESGKDQVVHRKYLKIDRSNGKKEIRSTKGTKRCLYGKNLVSADARDLVISEGEIDSLSWNSWSIPAVSIPNGVNDMEWIELDWDWLDRFERIYISTDMDDPGRACATDICKRLGLHRCYIVSLPKKDANECLVSGITSNDMMDCLKKAKQIEIDEIKRPGEYRAEVMDYYNTTWEKRGWDTPWWPKLPWRIRKAELTVLSGFSGSGKTAALNELMLHLISQGLKVMDASLEIKPGLTLYNMTRCALGKKVSIKEDIEACVDWLNESMFFLDCIGTVGVSRLMHAMEYAVKRHGIDLFVIDSLFKCGLSSEDYGGQREFADKLTTFCNNTGAHVILVAHSRKVSSGNELCVPTKADVAGSSDITNAAFNVVIWWRNKLKKRKLDEIKAESIPNEEEIKKWESEYDGLAVLDKQRFGEGEEAECKLWFHKDSTQFHTEIGKVWPYFKPKQPF